MNTGLTVAIVTKERPFKLIRCLESLSKQTLVPRVLIIDNDVKKSAYWVFKDYRKRLPLRYYLEKKSGVPYARNRALVLSDTRYLGYVDDDCILNEKWVEFALGALKRNRGIAYVCGKTKPNKSKNILAIAQHTRDSYWYLKKLKRNNQTLAEHFDTKNVVIDRNLVLTKKMKFDYRCSIGPFDSADFDFGLQLDHKSLRGIYFDKMRLTHEETLTLQRYVRRAFFRGKIAGYINKKWKLNNETVDLSEGNILIWLLKTLKKFPADFIRYTCNLKLPVLYKILVVLAIRIYEGAYLRGYISFKS